MYSSTSHRPSAAEAAPPPPKTLVESAYRNLRRNIIEGRLPPGEKLRIEHMKDDYGVGGATLREALSLLISDALVVSQGQRGFRVAPVSLEDLADITETRVMLEGEALRQSIARGDETWEANLMAAFHRLTRAEEKLAGGENRRRRRNGDSWHDFQPRGPVNRNPTPNRLNNLRRINAQSGR